MEKFISFEEQFETLSSLGFTLCNGLSKDVFVGKVIKQDGTKSLDSTPETQFKVEVSYNVKGKFNGTVIEEAKIELIEKYTTAYKNEIPFNMSKTLN